MGNLTLPKPYVKILHLFFLKQLNYGFQNKHKIMKIRFLLWHQDSVWVKTDDSVCDDWA